LADLTYSSLVDGPEGDPATDLDALAVLAEPQRRRMLTHVQTRGPSTVAELTDALSLGRTLVAFHLRKLVEAGFVAALAPEPSAGRTGRPAQRWGSTGRELAVSVPERRYDLLAGLLLDALAENSGDEPAQVTAERVARRRGAELAQELGAPRRGALARLETLLTALGYLPRRRAGAVQLLNCPFDRFRNQRTAQVCGVNLALAQGCLDGLDLAGQVRAELAPSPATCCVTFSTG
jgi:predicted ArsR family transcriptional regulator